MRSSVIFQAPRSSSPIHVIARKPLGDGLNVPGYDVLILSDLLYFDQSHQQLVESIGLLLSRKTISQAYVAAGMYTRPEVCDNFLNLATMLGLEYEEQTSKSQTQEEKAWRGQMQVIGMSQESLAARKANVRWWILWWHGV